MSGWFILNSSGSRNVKFVLKVAPEERSGGSSSEEQEWILEVWNGNRTIKSLMFLVQNVDLMGA